MMLLDDVSLRHGVNGLVFRASNSLEKHIAVLLAGSLLDNRFLQLPVQLIFLRRGERDQAVKRRKVLPSTGVSLSAES